LVLIDSLKFYVFLNKISVKLYIIITIKLYPAILQLNQRTIETHIIITIAPIQ